MNLKEFVGSGEKIGRFSLPFVIIGIILNMLYPAFFSIGTPAPIFKTISFLILMLGLTNWIWSVILVLTRLPQGTLITYGPFSLVKHPIYTGVALLVAPWIGFLFQSWLGVFIGIIVYTGCRLFAPLEEKKLSETFGKAWDDYCNKVIFPWL